LTRSQQEPTRKRPKEIRNRFSKTFFSYFSAFHYNILKHKKFTDCYRRNCGKEDDEKGTRYKEEKMKSEVI